MNKLFEAVDDYFNSDQDLIVEPRDEDFLYLTKETLFYDIKNFEIFFENGESLFIAATHLKDYYFQIIKETEVINDPIFSSGFVFRRGCLKIDSNYLFTVFGEDYMDQLIVKPNIDHIKIEYNDNHVNRSNLPFILLLPIDSLEDNSGIVSAYSDENNTFYIIWDYEKLI